MKRIQWFAILSFFEGLITLIVLLLIPKEANEGCLLGYSISRGVMILGLFVLDVFFAWLALYMWRNPKFLEKIDRRLDEVRGDYLWSSIIFLITAITFNIFLLLHWLIISSEEFLRAYLFRLTPMLIYFIFIFIQTIWIFIYYLRWGKGQRVIGIFSFGLASLLPWLFVGEYYLVEYLFPEIFVETYLSQLLITKSAGLFLGVLFLQVYFAFLRLDAKTRLKLNWFVIVFLFGYGWLFFNAARTHTQIVNTDYRHSDQGTYIGLAKKAYLSNFSDSGERNQTPLYPYIQAVFYKRGQSDSDFFAQGKLVNIILSLVLLVFLLLVFMRFFPLGRAVQLILVIANSVYIFKSGYFTAENLNYSLSFFSFLGMVMLLANPTYSLAIGTGVILGLAYYTKASVQPAIVIFMLIFFFQKMWYWVRYCCTDDDTAFDRKVSMKHWASLVLLLGTFLGVLSPYLMENKAKYGQYFYNLNSTFFIWYDDFATAKHDSELYAFGEHWPDMPIDQIPSLRNYIQEHNFSQIVERFRNGFLVQIYHVRSTYNIFSYPLVFLILLIVLVLLNIRQSWSLLGENIFIAGFVILYFFGYIVLYAWYVPIAAGPRFLLGLQLPYLFSVFMMLQKLQNKTPALKIKTLTINPLIVFRSMDWVIFALLITDFYLIITEKLPNGYYGS